MRFVIAYFVKRMPREGFKSLSVPALALVLVVLINLMGAVRARMEAEYLRMIEEYPIRIQVSDGDGIDRDGLEIGERYLKVATDPDELWSISKYMDDLLLKRAIVMQERPSRTVTIHDKDTQEIWPLVGLTSPDADADFSGEGGARIEWYGGYDEGVLRTDGLVCVVSGDLLAMAEGGYLGGVAKSTAKGGAQSKEIEARFRIVGTVVGAEGRIAYAPFWTVSKLASESDKSQIYTETMSATLADNREITEFKEIASRSFTRVGVYFNDKTFAMTIFDAEYYDKTEALTQTIYFISFATPFVYALTACTGFVASYLLTRRRRGEFANMRSVGINKRDIFIGALFEQSALCAIGAAIGCAAFRMAWGDVYIRESALFLACYTLGAAISAARIAGTDVLKILRDKE